MHGVQNISILSIVVWGCRSDNNRESAEAEAVVAADMVSIFH